MAELQLITFSVIIIPMKSFYKLMIKQRMVAPSINKFPEKNDLPSIWSWPTRSWNSGYQYSHPQNHMIILNFKEWTSFYMIQRKRKKRLHLNTDKTRTQKKIIDTPIEKHPKATHGLKRSPILAAFQKKPRNPVRCSRIAGNCIFK